MAVGVPEPQIIPRNRRGYVYSMAVGVQEPQIIPRNRRGYVYFMAVGVPEPQIIPRNRLLLFLIYNFISIMSF